MPAIIVLGLLTIGALAGVISSSLRPGAILGGSYSLDAWSEVFANDSFQQSILFTVRSAIIATALSVLIAIPLAFLLRHRRGAITRTAISTVVPVPHLVAASVLVFWLGPGGLFDRVGLEIPVVRDGFGLGLILVYVLKEVPFLILITHASLTDDLARREAAARSLGARRLRRWATVTIPAISQPLVLGGLLVAAFVVGSTEVPAVIGPSIAPEALSNWSITRVRIVGPIARADAAVALVTASLIVMTLTAALALAVKVTRVSKRAR